MKNELVKAGIKGGLAAFGGWVLSHRNVLLPVGIEACNGVAIFFAVRNSEFIMSKIRDGNDILAMEADPETRKKIYLSILKDIAPKIAPIAGFYAGGIALLIVYKKDNDKKDEQIAKLTEALTISQNALVSAQLWKQQAEKSMPKEQVEKVTQAVDQEAIRKDPPTKENTSGTPKVDPGEPIPTKFVWKDGNVPGRYITSLKGPNDVRKWIVDKNGELNAFEYSDEGNKISINEFYEFLDEGLEESHVVPALYDAKGMYWRLTNEDIHSGHVDAVYIDITTCEGPNQVPIYCFHCNFLPY